MLVFTKTKMITVCISQNFYNVVNVESDITGVRELKIVFPGKLRDSDWDESYFCPKVCLADLEISKVP